MAYIKIPRDLSNVKEKFMFGLTKRQVMYFAMGIAIGLPLFFIIMPQDLTTAVVVLFVCVMPFGFMGLYEKNGQTFDKILTNMIKANLFRPKVRPYKSENIYVALEEQAFLNREVKRIGYKKSFKDKLIEAVENSFKQRPTGKKRKK